jgi:transcriptional regulator with XRE-family HTH domain
MGNMIKSLGIKVRKHRQVKNYSTDCLAKRLSVSSGFINNLENGRNDIFQLELLHKLSGELDISIGELLEDGSIDVTKVDMKQSCISASVNIKDATLVEDTYMLSDHIKLIISSFIDIISEFQYSEKCIKTVSEYIISQLEYAKKFNKL